MISEKEKEIIIKGYESGMKPKDLASLLGRSRKTISSFYSKWKLNGMLPPKVKIRITMITSRMGLWIKDIVKAKPHLGIAKYLGYLKEKEPNESLIPSEATIRRYLKDQGIVRKVDIPKPAMEDRHFVQRLDFAKEWLGKGPNALDNVMWSDETMVKSHPINRKSYSYVHRTTPRQIQERKQQGGFSIMFWGCISRFGRGPLVVLEGNMNAEKYRKVVNEFFIPELMDWQSKGVDLILMQDGAPCHKAKVVLEHFRDTGFPPLSWPSCSPDLNPIENVWAWVKQKLYTEFPPAKTKQELMINVLAIWEDLDDELCSRYCSNYDKRLHRVVEANGRQIKS